MYYRPLRGILSGWALLSLTVLACGAPVGGCGPQLPVADYSSFGDPTHTRVTLAQDGDVLVIMQPKENQTYRREGLSIVDFKSTTGSKGKVFIHYPKGTMEMRLIAYDVNKADSDILFDWKVAQKGRVVQDMQARIVPGPRVQVFVDEQEIHVAQ